MKIPLETKKTIRDLYYNSLTKKLASESVNARITDVVLGQRLTNYQGYVFHTNIKISNITSTIDTLELTIEMISKFHPERVENFDPKNLNSEFVHELKYHIENYYFRTTKILDLLIILINHILLFGLDETQCNYKNLLDKFKRNKGVYENVKDNYDKLYSLILGFKKQYTELNKIRNRIVHRSSYSDDNLALFEAILFGRQMITKENYAEKLKKIQGIPDERLIKYAEEIIMKKLYEFRKIKSQYIDWTYNFLENLAFFFEMNIKNVNC